MSAAYDRRTSEEEVPGWADDESPAPADPEGDHETRPRCRLCRAILSEDGTCAPCVVRQAEIEASREAADRSAAEPCDGCGRPRGSGHVLGRCLACRMIAKLEAEEEERRRQLENSPHACACGVKLWRPGLCPKCTKVSLDQTNRELWLQQLRAGIPPRYRDLELTAESLGERIKDPSGVSRLRAACVAGTVRVTITGGAGTGKTSGGCALACGLADLSWSGEIIPDAVMFVSARRLALARQQAALGDEAEIVTRALEAAVLIVDDIGLEPADARLSALPDVVFARYEGTSPTIYTVASTPEELTARYGSGFARRLFERGDGSHLIDLRSPKGVR